MIDYLLDVKPLEPLSDARIALHLANRTANAISCNDARIALQESGAVVEDPASRVRSGALIDHYVALPDGEQKSLLGQAIAHLSYGQQISTHQHPRSVQFSVVLAGLPESLSEVAKSLIELGGGLVTPNVSEVDVVACRESHIAKEKDKQRQVAIFKLLAHIENSWINPAIESGKSVEEVCEEIKAGL